MGWIEILFVSMVNVPSLQRSDKHRDDGKCTTEHQERVKALLSAEGSEQHGKE